MAKIYGTPIMGYYSFQGIEKDRLHFVVGLHMNEIVSYLKYGYNNSTNSYTCVPGADCDGDLS